MAWLRDRVAAPDSTITTTDTWLLHRLCGAFVTDVATAGRTLLLDLDTGAWSDEACALFGIDPATLPRVVGNAEPLGDTAVFGGAVPVTGACVDQQAALFAEACRDAGRGEVHLRHRRVPAGLHRRHAHPLDQRARRLPGVAARRRARPGASTARCTRWAPP